MNFFLELQKMGPHFQKHMDLDNFCDFRPSSDLFSNICSKSALARNLAPKSWLQKPGSKNLAKTWPKLGRNLAQNLAAISKSWPQKYANIG